MKKATKKGAPTGTDDVATSPQDAAPDVIAEESAAAAVAPEPAAEPVIDDPVILAEPAPEPQPDPVIEDTPPADEPVAPVAAPVSVAEPARRSVVLPALLGGVLAAGIGFATAQFIRPEGWPFPGQGGGLEQKLAEQAQTIADLQARLDAVAAPPAPDLSGIEAKLAQSETALSDLAARLSAVESEPAQTGPAVDLTPLMAEIDALKAAMAERPAIAEEVSAQIEAAQVAAEQKLAEAEAQAAAMRAEAEKLAQRAAGQAALAKLIVAADGGQPLAGPVGELRAAGVDLPDALVVAEAGVVPTLDALQAAFPLAARAALATAERNGAEGGIGDRLTAFLLNQTNARSLEPREGDDPDAVLSRAEAAVNANDLPGALALIGQLPTEAQAEMTDWVALATARLDVMQAISALGASLAE